ncbi:hypothetical protein AVEN_191052-1 [Araneus ventricosus]|uniref:Uncharacterized protein n=1 Tax=Araneus ventricosus TaxID=182803 RepID=A0A4Y2AXJ7_ARAVE|nr:hypothetical protein AVEN_191052-1 [Araneus ventricosus]
MIWSDKSSFALFRIHNRKSGLLEFTCVTHLRECDPDCLRPTVKRGGSVIILAAISRFSASLSSSLKEESFEVHFSTDFMRQWPPSTSIQAYADDFLIVIQTKTIAQREREAHSAISKFIDWTKKNKLTVSAEKTIYLLFSRLASTSRIYWNTTKIKRVKYSKYLGIHIDEKLNWNAHLYHQSNKAVRYHKILQRIAAKSWGISAKYRNIIYKTVIGRMMAHGSAVWCLNPTSRMGRELSPIQRGFLLAISGAYRMIPTAVLQVILGIVPLHLQLEFESRVTTLFRLKTPLLSEITALQSKDIEEKATGWTSRPAKHPQPNQISLQDGGTSTTYTII